MIRRSEYSGASGSYVLTNDVKFLCDGMHCTAELNATNNALLRSYLWGSDVSGTMTGAGGVGGLLEINSVSNGVHFCAYDGNGNVTALVKGTDGTSSANYEFGPFGEAIRTTGPMAKENPYRFSTKQTDDATDLMHYEFRIYRPATGRWLSRDPFGEEMFHKQYVEARRSIDEWPEAPPSTGNAYLFVRNSGVNNSDMDGCRMTPIGDVALDEKNRRQPPAGMQLVSVPKCTILFVYGHNYVDNFKKTGMQWVWNIVPAEDDKRSCSFAAVGTCSAGLVPHEIPLPDFSYSNYDVAELGTISGRTLVEMWDNILNQFGPNAAAKMTCLQSGLSP